MVMLGCNKGWRVGGKGSVVARRSAEAVDLVTANGSVSRKLPEGESKLRIERLVCVETDKGQEMIVGRCSGLAVITAKALLGA